MHKLTLLAGQFGSQWLLSAMVVLTIFGCLAVWTVVLLRIRRGSAAVRYQPRCPVPWRGIDVLAVFLVYIVAPKAAMLLSLGWFDLGQHAAPVADQATKLQTQHPAARVLIESGNLWVLALCVLTVVVVAAIIEEFIFRLVFQGWLEAVENRTLRLTPRLRGIVPGTVAVSISSVFFAMVHYRPPQPPVDLRWITLALAVQAIMSLLALGFAVALLRLRCGATLEDFGVVPRELSGDVKLGLLAFLAVTPLVYLINIAVKKLLPESIVADPIPIFFLALALGILYFRTHRIVPAVVLHMAFNASGVLMALTLARQ